MGKSVGSRIQERAAAQVVDDDRAVLVGEGREGRRVRRLREAGHGEVGGMDAQDDTGPSVLQRSFEIEASRAIRRSDLDELRARPADDVRDPDAAADLHEFPARDDDPTTAPGQADRQRESRSVVVGDVGILGPGQGDQVILRDASPRASPSRLTIQFQQEVVLGEGRSALGDGCRPRRPTQIRVDDHPGRVDDRLHPGAGEDLEASAGILREGIDGARRLACRDTPAFLVDDRACDGRQGSGIHDVGVDTQALDDGLHAGRSRSIGRWLGRQGRPPWRERVGVEPTAPHLCAAPLVLKTRRPTGTHPLPERW